MSTENITQFPNSFVSYPTNRLTAQFNSRQDVTNLLGELEKLDVDLGSVYVLDGKQGYEALDPSGEGHGTIGKLSRAIHKAGSKYEAGKLESVSKHLKAGGLAVAVYAKDSKFREKLAELFRENNAEDITYAALFYIEDIE